jgi:serine/threonine protein phosphatase PrpC
MSVQQRARGQAEESPWGPGRTDPRTRHPPLTPCLHLHKLSSGLPKGAAHKEATVIQAAGRTDPGRVRKGNEDALVIATALGLFAVADGMGGHNAGEVASKIAVDTLHSFVHSSGTDSSITWPFGFNTTISFGANQITSAIRLANRKIRDEGLREAELGGMGSTIVVAMAINTALIYASVGDSRLYRWRQHLLVQLTEDDSWAASMIKAGASPETVRHHQMRHVLTRALGSDHELDLTTNETAIEPDDVFLLCSDGLHGPLGDDGIARLLQRADPRPEAIAAALVDAANEAGGPDNITAVVLLCAEPDAAGR